MSGPKVVLIRPDLNVAAGRPSNAEHAVAYCWRCGGPGGDDLPMIDDPNMPGEHRHLECPPEWDRPDSDGDSRPA